MAAIEMRTDLSNLLDAMISGNDDQIVTAARDHLQRNEAIDVLIGRIAMVAAKGDREGHIVAALAAAAMLSRYLHFIPQPLEPDSDENARLQESSRALPLFVQALRLAAPAVRAGRNIPEQYPEPLFPSAFLDTGKNLRDVIQDAVIKGDRQQVERILFGLYGTGADYRTMQVRTYDGASSVFQNDGHALIFGVRGFQCLDAVEWGDKAPYILDWLAPHLALSPNASEPSWADTVRNFVNEHADGLASLRKRLAPAKEEQALPVSQVVNSNADTAQVCQSVYDALIKGGASPHAVGSVIALAAAELLQHVSSSNREAYGRATHGLLYAAAARQAIHQTRQADEILPLLFFAASFVNTLAKENAARGASEQPATSQPASTTRGGGLISISQLEALRRQLHDKDASSAFATAQRYLTLHYEPRALFGTIGLAAALTNATADKGYTLQIVQAASEEFLAWPRELATTNTHAFLQTVLSATVNDRRDPFIESLA